MNMKIDYWENKLYFSDKFMNVIEIENKKYFYRFVNDLYSIYNNGYSENISFFEMEEEKNMNGKLKVFTNYFDFEFDSKKCVNDISKYVNESINDDDRNYLLSLYNKLLKLYNKILNGIDLPLKVENETTIDNITKMMKIGLTTKNDLLDNLLLLIDLERVLNTKNILFFVNLKQYLTRSELIELYKYATYNNVFIVLVDSQCYGGTLEYEKKLIIDENLDEFVIQ